MKPLLHTNTHTCAAGQHCNGTTLSLAVIEMTDVSAGGKTCNDYYGLFGVVV